MPKNYYLILIALCAFLLAGCAVKVQPADDVQVPSEIAVNDVPAAENEVPEEIEDVEMPVETTETEVAEEVVEEVIENETTEPDLAPILTESQNETNNVTKKDPFMERCKDSDVTEEFPDGLDHNVRGNVTIDGVAIKNGADFCNNIKMLAEWYCLDGIPRVEVYECPDRCDSGVCA